MASRQLHWALLGELQCPVCLEYMTAPIMMCLNGHNVCASCTERLLRCPTCRGAFGHGRNVALQNLAAPAVYPCSNRDAGCEETYTADNRESHLAVCWWRSTNCPYIRISGLNCPWTGTQADIAAHVLTAHNGEVAEVPAQFRVELWPFDIRYVYRKVVLYMGQLFCLTWNSEGDILRFAVLHIGTQTESNKFQCGIKIGNSYGSLSAIGTCQNYLDIHCTNVVVFPLFRINQNIGEKGERYFDIHIGKLRLEDFTLGGTGKSVATGPRADAGECQDQRQ
jgi:E3 ubiquitin-protein ligase SIAH1